MRPGGQLVGADRDASGFRLSWSEAIATRLAYRLSS
jgi:hypothetical protein